MQNGKQEGQGLSGPGGCKAKQFALFHDQGKCLHLNGRGFLVPCLLEALHQERPQLQTIEKERVVCKHYMREVRMSERGTYRSAMVGKVGVGSGTASPVTLIRSFFRNSLTSSFPLKVITLVPSIPESSAISFREQQREVW